MITIDPPLTVGEKPGPLEYTFTDSDGVAINLTGYTPTFKLKKPDETSAGGSASLASPNTAGIVTHTLLEAELDLAGWYFAQFKVDNGTNKYYSEIIGFRVLNPVEAIA